MTSMRAFVLVAVPVAMMVLSPQASAIPGYLTCPIVDDYQVDVRGDVTCDRATTVAMAYSSEGDRYQDIGEFTCYSAQADVFPIVLTCVSGATEVVVSQL